MTKNILTNKLYFSYPINPVCQFCNTNEKWLYILELPTLIKYSARAESSQMQFVAWGEALNQRRIFFKIQMVLISCRILYFQWKKI